MTNLLLLPGNSPRHAKWVDSLKQALASNFDTITAQHYRHWKIGEQWANVDDEITAAHKATQGLDSYTIIGKSIGTVIAVQATTQGLLAPQKLVLLGIPIHGGAEIAAFRNWLKSLMIPTVIIQNTHDPLGSFQEVMQAFSGISSQITFIETPGTTHDYLDFTLIGQTAILSPPIK